MKSTQQIKFPNLIASLIFVAAFFVTLLYGISPPDSTDLLKEGDVKTQIQSERTRKHRQSWGDFYQMCVWIKTQTPNNSLITFPWPPLPETTLDVGIGAYFLFPRTVRFYSARNSVYDKGPAYLFSTGEFELKNIPVIKRANYDDRYSLLLFKDDSGESNLSEIRDIFIEPLSPQGLLKAAFYSMLIFLIGLPVIGFFSEEKTLPGLITSSYLAGSVIFALTVIAFNIAQIPFEDHLLLPALTALAAPGLYWLKCRRTGTTGIPYTETDLLTRIIFAIFFGSLFAMAVRFPFQGYDTLAIWGLKAKALFAFKDFGVLAAYGNWPSYPPLIPLLLSSLASGGNTFAFILFPLFAAALTATLYAELDKIYRPPCLRAFAVLTLFAAGIFWEHARIAMANLALTVFVFKAWVYLIHFFEARNWRRIIPAAFMLSGAILCRPDGVLYLVLLSAILFVWCAFNIKDLREPVWSISLILPVFCYFLWRFFQMSYFNAPEFNWSAFVFDWPYFKETMRFFLNMLFLHRDLGFWPALFFVLLLTRTRNLLKFHGPDLALVLSIILCLFFFSYDVSKRWGAIPYFTASFARYGMPMIPVMALVIFKEGGRILKDFEDPAKAR